MRTQRSQAEQALEDLLDGPSDTELRAAEQAVAAAQSQLDKAEQSCTSLYSASDDAVEALSKTGSSGWPCLGVRGFQAVWPGLPLSLVRKVVESGPGKTG